MQCAEFEQILEQQAEGPLPVEADTHLESCYACRLIYEDLAAIGAACRELGAEEVSPSIRVWTSLRAQLESEGLIHQVDRGWLSQLHLLVGGTPRALRRVSFAGAYVSLLLIAAFLLGLRMPPQAATFTAEQPAGGVLAQVRPASSLVPEFPVATVANLNETLNGDLERVLASLPERDSSLTTSLQQNLGIVDNLIAVCEKSMREQPDNPLLRQYLYGAYQQKAVLLATAIDRSTLEVR
jgi:hypothetical protein